MIKSKAIDLPALLSDAGGQLERQLGLFAVLNLGIVDLLASGTLGSVDATELFFNARNCMYVHNKLGEKVADQIMSHGVQLQDLFEALPAREAQQEFQRELGYIRSLCMQLLAKHHLTTSTLSSDTNGHRRTNRHSKRALKVA